MATNTQRNSIDFKGSPNVTIVEAAEPSRNGRMCCMCVPEIVGVFAILSMYFFLGIFGAAASFVSLGSADDAPVKGLLSISGTLHTFIAIASALGITAIRKEKIVMMRRLSIAFWILTVLMLIFNLIIFILDIVFKNQTVQECENNVLNDFGEAGKLVVDCDRAVNASLTVEGFKLAISGIISLYFAFVVSRFARKMKKEVLPFTNESANGQNTPTYFVYSTQPPTSTNWVPPPTYSVRPTHPLPEDYNSDLKNVPLN